MSMYTDFELEGRRKERTAIIERESAKEAAKVLMRGETPSH
jgi:hypothetical protein